jgi:MarR family transcriptional regulator, organic hydroperoxide resistance regulator
MLRSRSRHSQTPDAPAVATFIADVLSFAGRVEEIRDRFGGAIGLRGTAYSVLNGIAAREGATGVGSMRLAEHLHLSPAFITIEVSKLVAAGLVRKQINGTDRRRVLLTVTADGRRRLSALAGIQAPVNDALFGALGAKEFATFSDVMSVLIVRADHALAVLNYRDSMSVNVAGGKA